MARKIYFFLAFPRRRLPCPRTARPTGKGSASRAKWQEKSIFFLHFRGAAYLARGSQDQQGKVVQAERNGKKNHFFLAFPEAWPTLPDDRRPKGLLLLFCNMPQKKRGNLKKNTIFAFSKNH
jgi:hypothetical protein